MEIRQMTHSDLEEVMALKESVGWNQVVWDLRQFLSKPELCLLALSEGKIVGTTTAYSYKQQVAWIGMVIVHENYRGKGISKQLLKEIIHRLKPAHQTIKLDATALGKPVYEKLGFSSERVFYRMLITGMKLSTPKNLKQLPIDQQKLAQACAKDRFVLAYDRSELLSSMAEEYPEWVTFKVDDEKGFNFLMGRNGSKFTQLGPLIADSDQIAIELLKTRLAQMGERQVVVDVNEDKPAFIEQLLALGFTKQREFVRMYLGDKTHVKEEHQYLILGPEFG